MWRVIRIEPRAARRLYVEFEDGVCGEIDLSARLDGPMFQPLRDDDFFRRAVIDEYGVVTWPNGADLAPDALHAQLQSRKVS